jgi:hypothetical protein
MPVSVTSSTVPASESTVYSIEMITVFRRESCDKY